MDLVALKAALLAGFVCQNSGNCCRREGYVYATLPELQKMAEFLELSLEAFTEQFVKKEDGWRVIASPGHRPTCFLSEDNRCEIYPVRPQACKTYPDWPGIWESESTVMAELAMCPGLKKAFLAYKAG